MYEVYVSMLDQNVFFLKGGYKEDFVLFRLIVDNESVIYDLTETVAVVKTPP